MSARVTARDLAGGKIAKVLDADGLAILIVEKGGVVYQVEAWSDEEGNAAGHLDVSVIEGATSGMQIRLAGPEEKAG